MDYREHEERIRRTGERARRNLQELIDSILHNDYRAGRYYPHGTGPQWPSKLTELMRKKT